MISGLDGHSNIGVLVTGGADSSLLLYLLCKQYTNVTPILIPLSDKKFQTERTKLVLNFLSKENLKFNDLVMTREIEHDQMDKMETGLLYEVYKQHNLTIHCTGVTLNPPIGFITNDLSHPRRSEKRDISYIKKHKIKQIKSYKHKDITLTRYAPFMLFDKKDIADLYKMHNLTDTLFPITASCSYQDPPCNVCWWCHERKWGFG